MNLEDLKEFCDEHDLQFQSRITIGLDSGVIHAPIHVGTEETCPPRRSCPGQGWEPAFCSIFGQELERVPATGRQHVYRKCAPCLAAMKAPAQDTMHKPKKKANATIDICKD